MSDGGANFVSRVWSRFLCSHKNPRCKANVKGSLNKKIDRVIAMRMLLCGPECEMLGKRTNSTRMKEKVSKEVTAIFRNTV
jgi:hypothetical protein